MTAGQPIIQSSTVTPGHVGVWTTDGVLQDGGPATEGALTAVGITANGGISFAISSANPPNPYVQYGVGVSSTGVITQYFESYGGAPAASVFYNINGVTYAFNPAGNGNITGPVSSVSGDIVTFNGTGGNLVEDSGISISSIIQQTSSLLFPTFANIAALEAATATTLPQTHCYVLGYTSGGDGGEGPFVIGTTTTANGVTIFNDASGRSWYRLTGGQPYSVKWGGATGNGTTDDTAAIQATVTAAIAASAGVYIPSGGYKVSSAITGTPINGLSITGAGTFVTFINPTSTTADVFRLTSTNEDSPITMSGFTIDYAAVTPTSGTIFNFTGGCGGLHFSNVVTSGGWNVLTMGNASTFNVFVTQCEFDGFLNDGITISIWPGGLIHISHISINCTSANVAGTGLLINGGQSIFLSDMNIQGPYFPIIISAAGGQTVTDITATSVWGDSAARGNTGGAAWNIGVGGAGTTKRIQLTNCWGGSAGLSGFQLGVTDQISLINCRAIANQTDGITLQANCLNILIEGCQVTANSLAGSGMFNGITVDPVCANISIIGNKCGPTTDFPTSDQAYGISVTAGATNDLIISLNLLGGNVTGGLFNGATGGTQFINNNLLV